MHHQQGVYQEFTWKPKREKTIECSSILTIRLHSIDLPTQIGRRIQPPEFYQIQLKGCTNTLIFHIQLEGGSNPLGLSATIERMLLHLDTQAATCVPCTTLPPSTSLLLLMSSNFTLYLLVKSQHLIKMSLQQFVSSYSISSHSYLNFTS